MAEVRYPRNSLTQMIEAAAERNRSGNRGGVASATSPTTVHSASMGPSPDPLPPLTEEEKAHLDQMARDAGVQDESLGPLPEGQYVTMEDAISAGAPVEMHASRVAATPRARTRPYLPDFRKVEGINLVDKYVLVDGMTFPISEADTRDFRQYVVEIAKGVIQQQLNEALSFFSLPESAEEPDGGSTTERASTEVQPEPEGDRPEPEV